jgi:hypothetical protein
VSHTEKITIFQTLCHFQENTMASAFALPPLPPHLKAIAHMLKTATEHETRDPVVTYWSRLAALQTALPIDKKSKEATAVLIPLMDWLEKEKKVSRFSKCLSWFCFAFETIVKFLSFRCSRRTKPCRPILWPALIWKITP